MRLLVQFKQVPEFINFCVAELKSLFTLHNIPPWEIFDIESQEQIDLIKEKPYMLTREILPSFPFVYLKNHSEEVLKSVISRSVLVKSFMHVISEGKSTEELIQNVNLDEARDLLESLDPFSFLIDTHNRWYQ